MVEEEVPKTEKAPALTDSQRAIANKELFAMFGLDIDSIEEPESAPKILDFEKFWKKSGFQYEGLYSRREVFIGADFNTRTQKLEVTESLAGSQYQVDNRNNHFINFHTEPADDMSHSRPADQLLEQIPDAYYDDMDDFLTDKNIQCEVIMRLINKKQAAVVVYSKQMPLRVINYHYWQVQKSVLNFRPV